MSSKENYVSNENSIVTYLHCSECLDEYNSSTEISTVQSPQQYSRIQVGWTVKGIQVWCFRHEANILHVDFQGTKHPANTTRKVEPN